MRKNFVGPATSMRLSVNLDVGDEPGKPLQSRYLD